MEEAQSDLLARLGPGAHAGDPEVASDFGRRHVVQPMAVTDASDELAAARALRVATDAGLPVAIRGAGHSCGGQALSTGVVLRSFSEMPETEMLTDNLVQVRGRTSWEALERFLNERGRSCPVLTDHLPTSVGGTLSVGGAGLGSIARGFQVDQVARLRLVLPDGSARWCSADEESELFRFALAGLGRVGYIEKVVLRTVAWRKFAHLYLIEHTGVKDMLASAAALARDPGGVEHFQAYGWRRPQIELGYYSDTKERTDSRLPVSVADRARYLGFISDYAFKIGGRRKKFLDASSDHFRVWGDFLLSPDRLEEFQERAGPILARPVFAAVRGVRYHLVVRRPRGAVSIPFLPSGEHPTVVSYGVYNMVPRGAPAVLSEVDRAMRDLLEAAATAGGRPYLYGDVGLDGEWQRRLYGPACDRLRALRAAVGASRLGPAME